MAKGFITKVGKKGRYLARGVTKRDWWDNFPNKSTRQSLKRETQRIVAEELDFRSRNW
jgi:hypothetical protein